MESVWPMCIAQRGMKSCSLRTFSPGFMINAIECFKLFIRGGYRPIEVDDALLIVVMLL